MVEIPKVLKRREKKLERLAEILEEQSASLECVSAEILDASKILENKLKAQVPRISKRSTATIKELLTLGFITFLAGVIFGPPLLNLALTKACSLSPTVCQQQGAVSK